MNKQELHNNICDLVKGTAKDLMWFNTRISDDNTQIIQTFKLFGHKIEASFDIIEILKRKQSCRDFINYLKINVEKAFRLYWEKLNEPKQTQN